MSDVEKAEGFLCVQCGKWHEELLSDMGFQLPDVVWGMDYLEKYKRASYNKDFCTLDGSRYFIRGLLCVPLEYKDGYFGWGLWVEVNKASHDLYLKHYHEGSDAIPAFEGRIANNIKGYPELLGELVLVKLYDEHRPFFEMTSTSDHSLAHEQRNHISLARHHEIAEMFT
jgi:hypothetical protein